MTRTFEVPNGLVGPKKGGYRFETPFKTIQTRWGKLRYKAMYFDKTQDRAIRREFSMQDSGYMTRLEYANVLVPAFKNVREKNGNIKMKRDGWQKISAWVVYARKRTARTA